MSQTKKNSKKKTKFVESQEEIKIQIGSTITELLGTTKRQNLADLESQFIDEDEETDIDPIIVEHVERAINHISTSMDFKEFDREDWLKNITNVVLESMGIAQPLTKDDKERISISVEKYTTTQDFHKLLVEKILPRKLEFDKDENDLFDEEIGNNLIGEEGEDGLIDEEDEKILLITKKQLVSSRPDSGEIERAKENESKDALKKTIEHADKHKGIFGLTEKIYMANKSKLGQIRELMRA